MCDAATTDPRIAAQIEACLAGHGPLWSQALAQRIAEAEWAKLAPVGLDRTNYGTLRFVEGNPGAGRDVWGLARWPGSSHDRAPVIIERLHGSAMRRYADLGLRGHSEGELPPGQAVSALEGAFARLAQVPWAAAAVAALVSAMHVIKPDGPDYDVSYSDPDVPFSIFIGIDAAPQIHRDLRLAEGILHECMHLQLTLIERSVPLVAGTRDLYHSPWTGTLRPVQGVMHALYVFRAIQDLCRALIDNGRCSIVESEYLHRRLHAIEGEVAEIREVRRSGDLTDSGVRFVESLLFVRRTR